MPPATDPNHAFEMNFIHVGVPRLSRVDSEMFVGWLCAVMALYMQVDSFRSDGDRREAQQGQEGEED